MSSLSLVLSGGGARAAYQAGAMVAIADICDELGLAHPFTYYTGISAGAINIAMLTATEGSHIADGSKKLADLWSRVNSEQVYITDPVSLSVGGLQWIADLSLGGLVKPTPRKSLLDPSPLKKLIHDNCHFENIQKNIQDGKFKAVAVSALEYFSTSTVTFIQGGSEIPMWQRVRRQSERSDIKIDHVLASAAIPLLFPPIQIDERHFGDGSIRNQSPCGPAIFMGADKLIAIGVRKRQDVCFASRHLNENKPPSVGRVVSVLLHALMMDGLEIDIERLDRINANIAKLSENERRNLSVRPIEYLWISPSRDIAEIASHHVRHLPGMIRYLLRGFGSLQETTEVASFLLFDPAYCGQLIELGFEDAMRSKDNITRLLTT
nr:patatin-like phospholipase family protein [uncultured Bdellovibrio sp.]